MQISVTPTSYHRSDHRILIVADDPLLSRMLEHHLRRADFLVDVAETEIDAAAHLADHAPHILITDWQTATISGIDLCRRVRATTGIAWVYSIILTAYESTDQVLEAFEAGADDFLTKPFDIRELLARVRVGERIVVLERELARQTDETRQSSARLEIANRELARVNDRLREMARTDELTGLGNRRAAMDELARAWHDSHRHGTPLACVIFDIDHFKLVNDTHGHDIGDSVLVQLSREIQRCVRLNEQAFRIGGEEFLLICPRSGEADAAMAAERIRAAVERLDLQIGGTRIRTTVSLGVAERMDAMTDAGELLKSADTALYRAKDAGRNCVHLASTHSEPAA